EIALDNNTDKFLGGKDYSVKIYKRTSATTTELVMNTTNKVTDKIKSSFFTKPRWSEQPPMFYAEIGELLIGEPRTIEQEGTLNNYSHLMMKNIPTGTSRVEVKYKVAGASQWSSLTSSAALYNNTAGWYKAGLNTLENNTLYDYQYLAYNTKGETLGGGQGVINTALNQATITQKALAATDLPSVYIDKQETVNTKSDVNEANFLKELSVQGEMYSEAFRTVNLSYKFDKNLLKKYISDNELYVLVNNSKLNLSSLQKAQVDTNNIYYPDSSFIKFEFSMDLTDTKYQASNTLDFQLVKFEGGNFIEIGKGSSTYQLEVYWDDRESYYIFDDKSYFKLNEKNNISILEQSANASSVSLYYREAGSNQSFKSVQENNFSKDIYGNKISGQFDVKIPELLTAKKYEIQYITYEGSKIVNRQQGVLDFTGDKPVINTTPLNYGGDGFILFSGTDVQFIDQFKPVTSTSTSAKLKIRKVGTAVWEQFALTGTSDWFSWNGNQGRDGEYEFQLDSFNGTTQTTPSGSIIGKLRLGSQPKVLSYIPKSFAQNQITFAGQPTGSNKVTVKYGTAAGLLNKTAVLTVGSDGKAILDATELAEQNLLGSTTVYYSYETTDANGKLLNRATGYVNVGVGAGSGQHTNQLNDSWLDFQPAQNNGSKMELFYRKRQVDASGNFVSDLVSADINSDAYWASSNQFQKVSITPSSGIYRWNLNDLVPTSGFENYEYFYQLYDSAGKVIAFVPGKLSIDSKGNGSSQQNKWVINGSGDRASQIVKSQAYNAFGEIISETDGNGNTSSLSYNTMGKLTKKVLPTVDIRKSDGTITQGTPTLEYGYDLSGRLLTSKDANGNINKQSYLNGRNLETGDWLVEKETHADTGEVSNLYDVYGNLIEQSNALGVKTGYSYDINGNLIQITRAARTAGTVGANHITSGGVQTSLIDTFTYDELGNRLSATNAL
ncbi:RHS repeat domain-containing protein, partial [Acinetobacter baumannii]